MLKRAALLVAVLALSTSAVPCRAQLSDFAANELRGASLRDELRSMRMELQDGTDGSRRLAREVAEAFRGTRDWDAASSSYYARKADLLARAAELDAKLAAAVSRNSPDETGSVKSQLEEIQAPLSGLTADFQLYMRLPKAAATLQRPSAQAAMRILAQTGSYPVTLAYFRDKAPGRAPLGALGRALRPLGR